MRNRELRGVPPCSTILHSEKASSPEKNDGGGGTALALLGLGDVARNQGNAARVIELCGEALAICREQRDNAYTGFALNNLGLLLKLQGDYAAARPYYERALAIRKKVLGEEHPHTAVSLNNLAHLLAWQSDYAAARPLSGTASGPARRPPPRSPRFGSWCSGPPRRRP